MEPKAVAMSDQSESQQTGDTAMPGWPDRQMIAFSEAMEVVRLDLKEIVPSNANVYFTVQELALKVIEARMQSHLDAAK